MKKPKKLNSAFFNYEVLEQIGQGGNGYVYKATNGDDYVAIKILDKERVSNEKLKRFKNEYRFCSTDRHKNIIKVSDYGLTEENSPFFVMPIYDGSLRKILGSLSEEQCFNIILKILDGVDAAHKFKVIHRDLKPENILFSKRTDDIDVVLADFGIALFGEDELYTAVDTKDGTRLANFQYAAPEQRIRSGKIDFTTDIYSLGLIMNELFTNELPLGKDHRLISEVSDQYSFLDSVVNRMLQQQQENRFINIEQIKLIISSRRNEYISSLKISQITQEAIPEEEIDDPIVIEPIRIVNVNWENGNLTLELNHEVNQKWIWALHNMGSFSSVMNKGPEMFKFRENKAIISARNGDEAQRIIDHFNNWLNRVPLVYKRKLEEEIEKDRREKLESKRRQLETEKLKKSINESLRF